MMHAVSTFQHVYTLWNTLYVTVHVLEHDRIHTLVRCS